MPAVTISRSSFPFVATADTRDPLQWNYGPLHNILLCTDIVRVSEAGVSWCVTCELHRNNFFNSTAYRLSELFGYMSKPKRYPSFSCKPEMDALCAAPIKNHREHMLLFPSFVVRMAADEKDLLLPESLQRVLESTSSCLGRNSNRQLTFGPVGYEMSLCDLVHNQYQFALFPEDSMVFWKQNDMSVFWNVSVTLMILFLFTRLSEYMSLLIRGKERCYSCSTQVAMCLTLVYSFVNFNHVDFSTEETLLNALLLCYTAVYILAARFAIHDQSQAPHNTNIMGALIALQLVLTAHMQHSYDTPFLNSYVMLFGSRSFLKFLNFVLQHCQKLTSKAKMWKFFFMCLDTLVMVSMLELAVRSSARSTAAYISTAVSLLISSVIFGTFLHIVINTHV